MTDATLPPHALALLGRPLLRHARRVRALAWSPDGARLASGGADGTARIHDAATGALLARVDAEGEVRALAFVDEGARLWVGGEAGLLLADAASGAVLLRAEGVEAPVRAIEATAGGRRMVTAEAGRKVRVRETVRGRVLRELEAPCEAPVIALTPDGRHVASGRAGGGEGGAGVISIHELTSGLREVRLGTGEGSELSALAFAAGGRALLAGERSGRLRRFDVPPRLELPAIQAHGAGRAITTIAVDPGSPQPEGSGRGFPSPGRSMAFATGGEDASLALFDLASGERRGRVEAHLAGVLAAAFSPDGRRVATAGEGCVVRLWDAVTLAPCSPGDAHEERIAGVAWVTGGARVVSAGEDGTVAVRDATTGERRAHLHPGPALVSLAAAAASPLAVAGASDGTVQVLDALAGRALRSLVGHEDGWARAVAITADGALAASGGPGGRVRLFDPASGERRADVHLGPSAGEVLSLAFVEGASMLAAVAAPGRRFSPMAGETTTEGGRAVFLVDAASGSVSREVALPESPFEARLVAPLGRDAIAVALRGPRVAIVPLRGEGARLLTLASRLEAIVASPDGTVLYGAPRLDPRDAGTGRVLAIDAATGKTLRSFEGPEPAPLALSLDAEGRRLCAGYADGTAVVWDVSDVAASR